VAGEPARAAIQAWMACRSFCASVRLAFVKRLDEGKPLEQVRPLEQGRHVERPERERDR